jgi:hypothetical protein
MAHLRKSLVAALLVVPALLLAAACKPSIGGSCDKDHQTKCLSKDRAAICEGGKWNEVSCGGPSACDSDRGTCDETVAKVDSACGNREGHLVVCSDDKKELLACADGKWKVESHCHGMTGCLITAFIDCDDSVSSVGDPCRTQWDLACSEDRRTELACLDGKWTATAQCRGKNACMSGGLVSCDGSAASVGGPCVTEGNASCSEDGKDILVCRKNVYVKDTSCGDHKCDASSLMVMCI